MVEVTGSSPVRPTYRTSFELEFLAWRLETSLGEDLGHFKSHPARATYRTSFELEFLAWRLETSLVSNFVRIVRSRNFVATFRVRSRGRLAQ